MFLVLYIELSDAFARRVTVFTEVPKSNVLVLATLTPPVLRRNETFAQISCSSGAIGPALGVRVVGSRSRFGGQDGARSRGTRGPGDRGTPTGAAGGRLQHPPLTFPATTRLVSVTVITK